jgi:hypothetical protein
MSDDEAPAPVTNNYEETMREALQAQVDLAPDLFAAESNKAYGRPAYARLMQDLAVESLLGEEIEYDDQGRAISHYESNKANYKFVTNEKEAIAANTRAKNLAIRDGKGKNIGSNLLPIYHVDTETLLEYGGTEAKFGVEDNEGNTEWFASQEEANRYMDSRPDRAVFKTDKFGKTIVDKSKAGTTSRAGGGIADILAGNAVTEFSDGTTRKAGFDEQGNFLGTSQMEQDMLERAKIQQTRSEIALVSEYGDDLTQAYRAQGNIQGALDAFNALDQSSDHGGLRSDLVRMAQEELAAGGDLTDRERISINEDARAAMSARGRGRSFQAVVNEVNANDTFRRQRQNERRGFAMNAIQLADSGLAQDRGYAAQRIGLEQATSADPFQAITGRTSGAAVASGQNLYGNTSAGMGGGPTLFNPAQGAEFMANQSAMINSYNAANYGAQQAKKAAMWGAFGNIAGQATGALIKRCWVAREVYGVLDPRWLAFRHWLDFFGPSWFRFIYIKFGERFARFIKDKPRLKARIRAWMDTKIKEII